MAGEISLMHYYDTYTHFYRNLIQVPLVSLWEAVFAKNHIRVSPDENFATQSIRLLHDASLELIMYQSKLHEILQKKGGKEHIDATLKGVPEASHKIAVGAVGIAK